MKYYEVDYCLLNDDFKEEGVTSRISYCIQGGDTKKEHDMYCEEIKEKLLDENEDDYTRWVFMCSMYKNLGKYNSHITVLHFRLRDSY